MGVPELVHLYTIEKLSCEAIARQTGISAMSVWRRLREAGVKIRPRGSCIIHAGALDGGTKTYHAWEAMKQRCSNPRHPRAKHYLFRGIKICPAWRNSFAAFLSDMGECPNGLTLERINNDKGYEPGNCRWATPLEQARNRRSRNQFTKLKE